MQRLVVLFLLTFLYRYPPCYGKETLILEQDFSTLDGSYSGTLSIHENKEQQVLQKHITDTMGCITSTTYDIPNRIESIVKQDPMGHVINHQELHYDAAGNKVRATHTAYSDNRSAHSFATTWTYGPMNRLDAFSEAVDTPQQRTTQYLYNLNGQLEQIIKPDGVRLIQQYEPSIGKISGRLVRFMSSDHSFSYEYTYDNNGNLSEIHDLILGTTTVRTYNRNGQIIHEKLGNGLSIDRIYDNSGRRVQLILPDGSGVEYGYEAEQLTIISRLSTDPHRQYTHQYTSFNSKGQLTTAQLIGDLGEIRYERDSKQRLVEVSSPFWAETIPDEGYDAIGNVTKIHIRDPGGVKSTDYSYDANQQLIAEKSDTVSNAYLYDGLRNRISKNGVACMINGSNQIVEASGTHYTYDNNGCLIKKSSKTHTVTYNYDALDRLVYAVNGNQAVSYTYDPFGRCLTKTTLHRKSNGISLTWIADESIRYLYDGNNEIGVVDAKGALAELRVLGIGLSSELGAAVAIELAGNVYAPIHDHCGSVRCLIDLHSQQPMEYYRYSAFGEIEIFDRTGQLSTYSNIGNPWRFSSKRFDAITGLIGFGHRNYDANLGRWTTPDPLGFIDGPNRYAYVKNNPLILQDCYGLFSFTTLWDSLVSSMAQLFDTMSTSTSSLISALRGLSYTNHVEVDVISQNLFGKRTLAMTGHLLDVSETGVYGNKELNDKIRVTAINGILNLKEDYVSTIEALSASHGNINIYYVFHPTEGWAWDLLKATAVKFGYVSYQAHQLADLWKKLIQEMGGSQGNGLIIHYAHSIGGTDTYAAKHLLTPEEQKMIRVITVGSASMIPHEGFESVRNYVSTRDGVCLLDPIGYCKGLFARDSNVIYVGSYYGVPFIDHVLSAETYSRVIDLLGREFLEEFG